MENMHAPNDVLSLLCEGDASTWDQQAWKFDANALQAQPNNLHTPTGSTSHLGCCANKRSRGIQNGGDGIPAIAPPSGTGVATRRGSCCNAGVAARGLSARGAESAPPTDFLMACSAPAAVAPGAALQMGLDGSRQWPAGQSGDYDLASLTRAGSSNAANAVGPEVGSGMQCDAAAAAPLPDDAIVLQGHGRNLDPSRCWVVGCKKRVTELREFHARYHICADHIRANCIVRNDQPERFCQQCARFHHVDHFDGNRRSCRVQLAKHNERRRKRPVKQQPADAAEPQADTHDTSLRAPASARTSDGKNELELVEAPPAVAAAAEGSVASRDSLAQQVLQGLMSNPSLAASLRRVVLADGGEGGEVSDARAAAIAGAVAQLQAPGLLPAYAPRAVRLSLKLLRCMPDDLPPDLKPQLLQWLEMAPPSLEGCIRPGCVMLTVQATVSLEVYARLKSAGVASLVSHLFNASPFWHRINMVAQVFDQVAICAKGRLICLHDVTAPALAASLPRVYGLSTHVVVSDGVAPLSLTLAGERLNTPGVRIVARQASDGDLVTSTRAVHHHATDVQIAVPPSAFVDGCALLWVEAQMGGFLTEALPLLVCRALPLAARVHDVSCRLMSASAAAPTRKDALHWALCNEVLLATVCRPHVAAMLRAPRLFYRPPPPQLPDGGAGKDGSASTTGEAAATWEDHFFAGVFGAPHHSQASHCGAALASPPQHPDAYATLLADDALEAAVYAAKPPPAAACRCSGGSAFDSVNFLLGDGLGLALPVRSGSDSDVEADTDFVDFLDALLLEPPPAA